MSDVFISYSRHDADFVHRLNDALVENNHSTWVDWEDIPPTAEWMEEIFTAIEAAHTFIFVISPASLTSPVCNLEVAHAISNNKRLMPLVRTPVEPEKTLAEIALVKTETIVKDVLQDRDLLIVARDNWENLQRHNWIFFDDDSQIENQVTQLIDALDTDLSYVKMHTRILVRAKEWDLRNRHRSFLLQGIALQESERWWAESGRSAPKPTSLQTEYIIASRDWQRMRQRRTLIGITTAFIVSLLLGMIAFFQYLDAESNRVEAENHASTAEFERDRADQNARISRSRELSALGLSALDDRNNDLALLLSLEAFNTADTFEATDALLTSLQASPQLQEYITTQDAGLRAVTYSPDGKILAFAGADQVIRLWNMESHEQIGGPLVGHTAWINALAFSPNGQMLISAGADNSIRRWDVARGNSIGEPLMAHTDGIWTFAFSPDGETFASAGEDQVILLWDVISGEKVGSALIGHQDTIFDIAYSADGQFLASVGADNDVRLWNITDAEPKGQIIGSHDNWILSVAFHPDGTLVASAGADNLIRLWNVRTGELVRETSAHTDWIRDIAFSPDGSMLAAGSADQTITLWNTETLRPIMPSLEGHRDAVWSLAFSPDGNSLVSVGLDGNVLQWNPASFDIALGQKLFSVEAQILSIVYPTRDKVVVLAADGTVSTVNMDNQDSLEQHIDIAGASAALLDPDGQQVAVGFSNGSVHLWDVATERRTIPDIQPHKTAVLSLAFSPDGSMLATGDDGGNIVVWDMIDLEPRHDLQDSSDSIMSLAYSPDGQELVSGTRSGVVSFWNAQTGELLAAPVIGHVNRVQSLAYSPDGRFVASGGWDAVILLWDVSTRSIIRRLNASDDVFSLVFNPDSEFLFSGDQDDQIIMWDVATGYSIGQAFRGHAHWVLNLDFSPNGKGLISGSRDGVVILWDTDVVSWQQKACAIANRSFSMSEISRYFPNTLPNVTRICSP